MCRDVPPRHSAAAHTPPDIRLRILYGRGGAPVSLSSVHGGLAHCGVCMYVHVFCRGKHGALIMSLGRKVTSEIASIEAHGPPISTLPTCRKRPPLFRLSDL